MAIDFEAEGLLEGLDGKAREARRELLEELAEDGVIARGASPRRRGGPARAAAASSASSTPSGPRYTMRGGRRGGRGSTSSSWPASASALGLPVPDPDEAEFTDERSRGGAALEAHSRDAGVSDEAMLEFARVLGLAMSQVATTNLRMIADGLLQPGDTELDAATRFAAGRAGPDPRGGADARLRLRDATSASRCARTWSAARRSPRGGSQRGRRSPSSFADLVGFTKLGEQIGVEELGAVTGRLGELAQRGREPRGPAREADRRRGDAGLAARPTHCWTPTLALVEAADEEGEGFPLLRAGVATGEALTRGGDWFGRPVNLASRITAVAYPASVLCAADVREAARGRLPLVRRRPPQAEGDRRAREARARAPRRRLSAGAGVIRAALRAN